MTVRFASYLNGTNSSTLLFTYTVQTGDMCANRLDYWADARNMWSSRRSFDTSTGVVLSASWAPTLEADLHLNPAG